MNRIIAVALLSIAAPFAISAAGCGAATAHEPTPPATAPSTFIPDYIGAIIGSVPAGSYRPGTNPLDELLGR